MVSPSGQFAYAGNNSTGDVSAYTVNSSTGALTPVAGSPWSTGGNTSDLAILPSGRVLYATVENGTVAAFSINAATGALAPHFGFAVRRRQQAARGSRCRSRVPP